MNAQPTGPAHASRGADLLDRTPPADYLSEWTERFAGGKGEAARGEHSVIVFRVAAERLALRTALLVEVTGTRAIHTLPHRRDPTVLGLANVRGELLVCASLADLLKLEKSLSPRDKQRGTLPRLLVVGRDGERVAFPVDEVHGTHRFHAHELQAVPATVARSAASYMKAVLPWGEGTAGLLDEDLLLYAVNHRLT